MLRTPIIAALAVVLLGGTAMAQSATSGPSRLNSSMSDSARSAPDYDEEDDAPPPARDYSQHATGPASASQQAANDRQDRDMFCRRDAAARTGYTTPREAARDEQTRGTVGGVLGGAVLGTILGAAGGNAGLGAAAGAGAGLIAGTAIGSDNARHAARDVEADYANAYYDCMHEDAGRQATYDRPPPDYAYGPPPPVSYYPAYPAYPAPYGYPYYPYYYGAPSLSFGFGLGGGWGGGHGWGGRGFRGGGWRH
jgi:hypothetical protein